ncbi:MAG: lamin tail domain-containing protein [Cyclobacteriaceae bacterium]|nr:lamin tail domain-containing protein [Cyclobacteriaceae bacterium]
MKSNLQICRFSILKTITEVFFLTFAFLMITQQMFAQLTDDFSDGDFTRSPEWSGMDSHFIIFDGALRLNADPMTGMAYLSVPSTAMLGATWEFVLKLDFNPSNANYAQVYLVSDQPNLAGPLNGYYVLVGNTTDDVSLYKQTGTVHSKIIDGRDGLLNLSGTKTRIKVTRFTDGSWELFSDLGAMGNYFSEGSVQDTTNTSSYYFGVLCTYTATRSDKFYFDDFLVAGDAHPDGVPPELNMIEVVSSNELLLVFSENLDQATTENVTNYSVNSSLGNPSQAVLQENRKEVVLFFEKPFSPAFSYTLTVTGIEDTNGNLINTTSSKFVFFESIAANPKDIIFSEILADPTPKAGLPETEFVELFNRSEFAFDLSGWKITDLNSTLILPSLVLLPGEYLILSSSATEFTPYGKAWGASNFPSLNNDGDLLLLEDVNGVTIDSLRYSDSWYKDNEKKNGGWSLELIDTENLCSEKENWIASEDLSGGTPGKQNSVRANKPDLTGPRLISAIPLSPASLKLTFDEKLEKLLPEVTSFVLNPGIAVDHLAFADASLTSIILSLARNLQQEIVYSITVNSIYDCTGNAVHPDGNSAHFGIPQSADAGEIVINEILFNPRPMGVDFVEIVNTSSKFINLKNYSISNIANGTPANARFVTNLDLLLHPGGYLALTENLNALKGEYPQLPEAQVLVVDDLPAFNDDEGTVALLDDQQHVLDAFHYNKNLHTVFINDDEGVSLERINFTGATNDPQNWKSASSLVGFATPGYLNSNAKATFPLLAESIHIEPEIFDPLAGNPDFTQIHFKFDQGGFVANIRIYDDQGHLIKRVANNEVLGSEGTLRWDGDRDDGNKARIGYYMVWFEVFDTAGKTITYRIPVAIAAHF